MNIFRIQKRLSPDQLSQSHGLMRWLYRLQVLANALGGFLRYFVSHLSRLEKFVIAGLVGVIFIASVSLLVTISRSSDIQPVRGGSIIEGIVGRTQVINPLYSGNNPADRDISQLVFSGLVKLGRGREFLPDLAVSWEVLDSGKTYLFKLRDNIKWHDGEEVDADDVVFTIQVIQNEGYTGPLKNAWQGVEVTAMDSRTVRFALPNPSTFFLSQATVGIIPTHLFAHLPVANIGNPENNRQPVGTGPYQILDTIASKDALNLVANDNYYANRPFIDKIVVYFFDSEKSLLGALGSGTVTSASFSSLNDVNNLGLPNTRTYSYQLPQYKAVFFNALGGNPALSDKAVRQALASATDKQKIVQQVANGNAEVVDSPILPGFWGHLPDIKKYPLDFVAAREVLNRAGWKDVDKDGVMEKDNNRLAFTLSFKNDAAQSQIADILKSNWSAIGVEVTLNPVANEKLVDEVIRPRNYEALMFGQNLGSDSDPYVYWHSSQVQDPGLSLSVIADKDIDNNLEMARLSSDINKSISYYHKFQNAFANLVPAVLLYQPNFTYLVDAKVRGVTSEINLSNPSDRFLNVTEWYIKSRRSAQGIIETGLTDAPTQ
ncbi:peptide ABC transporter substrate-binding protein [Patescibacteria group bacterium]|nr:peptide ABC transporter substrate-binding protein [Patescibacteria group bacterium]